MRRGRLSGTRLKRHPSRQGGVCQRRVKSQASAVRLTSTCQPGCSRQPSSRFKSVHDNSKGAAKAASFLLNPCRRSYFLPYEAKPAPFGGERIARNNLGRYVLGGTWPHLRLGK